MSATVIPSEKRHAEPVDFIDSFPPGMRARYDAAEEAQELHSAKNARHHKKMQDLQGELVAAQRYRAKIEDHHGATDAHKASAAKDVAKIEAKTSKLRANAPVNTSMFSAIEEARRRGKLADAFRKWQDRGQDLTALPFRDVERAPDPDEPPNPADALPYYADLLKVNAATTTALQGRVLPKEIVERKVRDNFSTLFKGGVPRVGSTRRMRKDANTGRLTQGNVLWPTRFVYYGASHREEPDLAKILLWAMRDTVEAKLIAEALNYDDDDDNDLATRGAKLAALEAERIRLTRNAEHWLREAGPSAERTWQFDALLYLGAEIAI